MDAIVSDIAGEVDNSMIKDRVGRRIAQIDAGQARVVIDLECHGAAETLTDGLDLRNGGPYMSGAGAACAGTPKAPDATTAPVARIARNAL